MRKTLGRTLTLVAAVALLAGPACGGSKTPTAEEDRARAERMVLTLADLPGYTQDPEDGSEDGTAGPINDCVNNNPTLIADPKPRGSDSPQFSKDDDTVTVGSNVFFAAKVPEARRAFADFKSALTTECFKKAMKDAFEEGGGPSVSVRNVTTSPLPTLKVADDYTASRTSLDVTAEGEQLSVHFDIAFLRTERALAGLFTVQLEEPFPDAERTRLATLLGQRMSGKSKNTHSVATEPEGVTGTTATAPVAPAEAGFTTYRDPSGVTLEHPRSWTTESGTAGPMILFMDPAAGGPFRRNVNVTLQSGPEPMTLDEYTLLNLEQIHAIKGSVPGQAGPTTLSGSPAYRIAYRADLGSGDLRFLSVWTIRSGKAWVVTYTADPERFDDGLADVERLLTTIQLPD